MVDSRPGVGEIQMSLEYLGDAKKYGGAKKDGGFLKGHADHTHLKES